MAASPRVGCSLTQSPRRGSVKPLRGRNRQKFFASFFQKRRLCFAGAAHESSFLKKRTKKILSV
jgi:hypothetical protein